MNGVAALAALVGGVGAYAGVAVAAEVERPDVAPYRVPWTAPSTAPFVPLSDGPEHRAGGNTGSAHQMDPNPGLEGLPKDWHNPLLDVSKRLATNQEPPPKVTPEVVEQVRKQNKRIGSLPEDAYVQGEVLVRFKDASSKAERSAARAAIDSTIVSKPGYYDELQLIKLPDTARGGQSVAEAITALSEDPSVLYAEPNYRGYLPRLPRPEDAGKFRAEAPDDASLLAIPNDPFFPNQWDQHIIRAPEAWDYSAGSDQVTIADVDTGVDPGAPDIYWPATSGMISLVPGDDPGYPWDHLNHGTGVLGTALGRAQNGVHIAGTAHWSRWAMIKIYGNDSSWDSARIVSALAHVRGINARIVLLEVQHAAYFGSLHAEIASMPNYYFVIPAGNYFMNLSSRWIDTQMYPCEYKLPNLTCVAASTRWDTIASYSNYDNWDDPDVHLAAPAGDWDSIDDLMPLLEAGTGSLAFGAGGTSNAAPHVAGVASMIMSMRPRLPASEVKYVIEQCATQVPALRPYLNLGRRLDARCPVDFLLANPGWYA